LVITGSPTNPEVKAKSGCSRDTKEKKKKRKREKGKCKNKTTRTYPKDYLAKASFG